MNELPITRVVLYKHGVGYFERQGGADGDVTLSLTFKQSEVSDVLKSLTALDLDGGHIASVSYDSTKPLDQLLDEVSISIPDMNSLVGLLPQIKGARVSLHTGVSDPIEGVLLGVDSTQRRTGDGVTNITLVSVLTDQGEVQSQDLHQLASVQLLDAGLRRDLDYYLRTQLSSKKKDARTFTFFAQGDGERRIRLSYTLAAPVWKATYRILLNRDESPMIQGWAVVDNMQDEDWENVRLSLVAGLPVSFVHDLYTPRYIRRPEVQVEETTGVLPPEVEEGMALWETADADKQAAYAMAPQAGAMKSARLAKRKQEATRSAPSSMPAQVRERKIGDLFEYEIENPVTIRRNQSALVPIVLRDFEGRSVLHYNKQTRPENPMRCVEFKNTTGLTLEGGPVTVLEDGNYVGEAMLETMKPDEERLVPYAVELSVSVLDNIDSHKQKVHRVVIRNGHMTMTQMQMQKTTHTFHNKSDTEYMVYLDFPRQQGWKLAAYAKPYETTENFWRFRFLLPAKKTMPYVVECHCPIDNYVALTNFSERQLLLWTKQRYVDEATQAKLQGILQLQSQSAGHARRIQELSNERNTIYNEQQRIRENMNSLGDRPSEKELRERFVKTLNTQEDRLGEIDQQIKVLNEKSESVLQEINGRLEQLEYDARFEPTA